MSAGKFLENVLYFVGPRLLNINSKVSLAYGLSSRVILDVLPSKDSANLISQSRTQFSTRQKMFLHR